jgi:hypothetical protein
MEASRDEHLVVLSGLPIVPQQSQGVLSRFLLRKLTEPNTNDHSRIYVPVDGTGQSLGYIKARDLFCGIEMLIRDHSLAVVRYSSSDAVDTSIGTYNGTVLDQGHVMTVERLEESQAFRTAESQGDVDEQQLRSITVLQVV